MTPSAELRCIGYEGGVVAVDSGYHRPNMAACYLVESDTSVAIVETGTNDSVPRLLKALEERGWTADDVRYVIVTHVHLDHAGGAGSLLSGRVPAAATARGAGMAALAAGGACALFALLLDVILPLALPLALARAGHLRRTAGFDGVEIYRWVRTGSAGSEHGP